MNIFLLVMVEEYLNRHKAEGLHYRKLDSKIQDAIKERMDQGEKMETLYTVVQNYIKRLNNVNFQFKNGNLNETAFCKYARIDKSTWSDLRYNQIVPSKETLLKLVIALRLNEQEAEDLLHRGSNSFDMTELRDQIILALIDIRCYNIEDVYEVLEEYRKQEIEKNKKPFKNIY